MRCERLFALILSDKDSPVKYPVNEIKSSILAKSLFSNFFCFCNLLPLFKCCIFARAAKCLRVTLSLSLSLSLHLISNKPGISPHTYVHSQTCKKICIPKQLECSHGSASKAIKTLYKDTANY